MSAIGKSKIDKQLPAAEGLAEIESDSYWLGSFFLG